MHHLVEGFLAQDLLDVLALQPHDTADVGGAVVHEPDADGVALRTLELHRGADGKLAFHPDDPARQQALAAAGDRPARARVHGENALGLEGEGDPALAPIQLLRPRNEIGAAGLAREDAPLRRLPQSLAAPTPLPALWNNATRFWEKQAEAGWGLCTGRETAKRANWSP